MLDHRAKEYLIINPRYHGIQFHMIPLMYNYKDGDFNRSEEAKSYEEDIRYFTKKTIQVHNSYYEDNLPNYTKYYMEPKKIYWVEHIDIIDFDLYDEVEDLNYFNIIIKDLKKAGLFDKFYFLSNNVKKDKFKKVNHRPINTFIGVSESIPREKTLDSKVDRGFTYKFLCLNRKPKRHREYIVNFLKEKDLLKDTFYTYNNFKVEEKFLEGDNPNIPGFFTGIKLEDANKTFCNIITETMFYKDKIYGDNIFLTEKIDRCFAQCTPFIVASTPQYLEYIKELGFKTFDKWWDESYDLIEDDDLRIQAVCKTIEEVGKWSIEKCNDVYREMRQILRHNYKLHRKIKEYRKIHDVLDTQPKAGYFNFCFYDELKQYLKNEAST